MSTRAYLSIGDVLTLLRQEFPDVTISKIRFLESQGLVNPERSPSGYRKFYEHDVARLRWVLRQQREHFLPLKVIRDRLEHEGDKVLDDSQQVATRDDLVAVGAEVPNAESVRADATRSDPGHPAESARSEPMATVRALPTGGSARSQGGDAFPRALRRTGEPSIMRGPGGAGHGEPSLEHHPAHPRSTGIGLAPERTGEDPVTPLDREAIQHQLGQGMDHGSPPPPIGGPAVGGPAVGGPDVGGPDVGGPAVGGPDCWGPGRWGPGRWRLALLRRRRGRGARSPRHPACTRRPVRAGRSGRGTRAPGRIGRGSGPGHRPSDRPSGIARWRRPPVPPGAGSRATLGPGGDRGELHGGGAVQRRWGLPGGPCLARAIRVGGTPRGRRRPVL